MKPISTRLRPGATGTHRITSCTCRPSPPPPAAVAASASGLHVGLGRTQGVVEGGRGAGNRILRSERCGRFGCGFHPLDRSCSPELRAANAATNSQAPEHSSLSASAWLVKLVDAGIMRLSLSGWWPLTWTSLMHSPWRVRMCGARRGRACAISSRAAALFQSARARLCACVATCVQARVGARNRAPAARAHGRASAARRRGSLARADAVVVVAGRREGHHAVPCLAPHDVLHRIAYLYS